MNKQESLLFIGDSITEAGRFGDPEDLGDGYVRLIHDYFMVTSPPKCPQFVNRGISGNHITDLMDRWDRDVISLQPDYISISIGINDVWRRLDHPEKELVLPEKYEELFRVLINGVRTKTKAKIILMEPTLHGEDPNSQGNTMLKDYLNVVRKLSLEYDSILVNTHETFLRYKEENPQIQLTTDGVHMNSLGNMLMAKTWIEAFKKWEER